MTEPNIATLAQRIHERWRGYRLQHPGRSVPVSDTLSRILEHDPTYVPQRSRVRTKQHKPIQNPGIFTVQRIAQDLGTTVGALLGEPGHQPPRDLITPEQRRTLRDAWRILRDLFDLDDPSI